MNSQILSQWQTHNQNRSYTVTASAHTVRVLNHCSRIRCAKNSQILSQIHNCCHELTYSVTVCHTHRFCHRFCHTNRFCRSLSASTPTTPLRNRSRTHHNNTSFRRWSRPRPELHLRNALAKWRQREAARQWVRGPETVRQ